THFNLDKKGNSKPSGSGRSPLNSFANRPVKPQSAFFEFCSFLLNLTDNMRVALERRIKGLSYPEIGRVLSRAQSTVFEYFIKMRQRYTAIYG
ncbi:MAG: hypothetical protein MR437_03435, partial [Clostridiales bacterium]|nr:hypothetical protein [Clostridiales bacterium]